MVSYDSKRLTVPRTVTLLVEEELDIYPGTLFTALTALLESFCLKKSLSSEIFWLFLFMAKGNYL
jgi:hypothetical protein